MKTLNIEPVAGSKAPIKDILFAALNAPLGQGFTPKEMKDRIKVMEKIEKADGGATLKLEDAEFETIAESFKNMEGKWAIIDKAIVAMDERIAQVKM